MDVWGAISMRQVPAEGKQILQIKPGSWANDIKLSSANLTYQYLCVPLSMVGDVTGKLGLACDGGDSIHFARIARER